METICKNNLLALRNTVEIDHKLYGKLAFTIVDRREFSGMSVLTLLQQSPVCKMQYSDKSLFYKDSFVRQFLLTKYMQNFPFEFQKCMYGIPRGCESSVEPEILYSIISDPVFIPSLSEIFKPSGMPIKKYARPFSASSIFDWSSLSDCEISCWMRDLTYVDLLIDKEPKEWKVSTFSYPAHTISSNPQEFRLVKPCITVIESRIYDYLSKEKSEKVAEKKAVAPSEEDYGIIYAKQILSNYEDSKVDNIDYEKLSTDELLDKLYHSRQALLFNQKCASNLEKDIEKMKEALAKKL